MPRNDAFQATVVIDGYMTHSACLGNLTAQQFVDANSFSRESLSGLLCALVIHDTVIVGPDVIGSVGGNKHRTRVPVLAEYFSGALEPKETVPSHPDSRIARDYDKLRDKYSTMELHGRYEDALNDLVENFAFKTSSPDVEQNMRKADPRLYTLLVEHTQLRARMYVQEARRLNLPYVPNPIRRKLFDDEAFIASIGRDFVSVAMTDGTFGEHVMQDIVAPLREEYIDKYIKPVSTISSQVQFELPAFMQLILNESRECGVFETAAQLRDSPEVVDFRAFCRELQLDWVDGVLDHRKIDARYREIEKAREVLRSKLRLEKLEKNFDLRAGVGFASIGTKLSVPATRRGSVRPAYAFLYDVTTAFGRPQLPSGIVRR